MIWATRCAPPGSTARWRNPRPNEPADGAKPPTGDILLQIVLRDRHDLDLDAPVRRAAILGIVRRDRLAFAEAARADPRRLHAARLEIARDRRGAAFGQALVVGIAAGRIGVAVDVDIGLVVLRQHVGDRSEEHTSELQSLMRISYAVFCLNKKKYHS